MGKPIHELLKFKDSFINKRVVISAPSGYGKEYLMWGIVMKLLECSPFKHIVFVAPKATQDSENSRIIEDLYNKNGITFTRVAPNVSLELPKFKESSVTLYDDCMKLPGIIPQIEDDFVRARHEKRHVIFISQSLRKTPGEIIDNATDIIFAKSFGNETTEKKLGLKHKTFDLLRKENPKLDKESKWYIKVGDNISYFEEPSFDSVSKIEQGIKMAGNERAISTKYDYSSVKKPRFRVEW